MTAQRSGREMKLINQSINYFWVALLSSLATYGITKYVEFSEPPVFEKKIGSTVSPFRVAIFDISEHPGAAYKTYEFRSYVDGMSLPRSTLILVSKEELNEFRIESVEADSFRIYSKNTLLASCTKESWSLHYGLLNI